MLGEQKSCDVLRGAILSCRTNKVPSNESDLLFLPDGVVVVSDGKIQDVMAISDYKKSGGDISVVEHLEDSLIVPGFIDAHIHHTQMGIIASYGYQLLDWLENYAFPAEKVFSDPELSRKQAESFLECLFKHGTTTAMVFTSMHVQSAESLFEAARSRNVCMIAGKVMMDRGAPATLLDSSTGFDESAELIERWHGQGRLCYAVTPRFALTSTPTQLTAVQHLLKQYPDIYLHTHLAENRSEVTQAEELYPDASSYTDIYAKYGLLTERSFFAHGIYLSDTDLQQLATAGSTIIFCPTSNTFLGSGLLNTSRLHECNVSMAIGTDIGGGTSYSMLATLGEGYKVSQLQGLSWDPVSAFHMITAGNADALDLGHRIGRIAPGMDADLVVLKTDRHPILKSRLANSNSLTERLFAMMILGDDRIVERTYVAGKLVHEAAVT